MSTPPAIRDRITGFARIPAGQLAPHPSNWRRHPDVQRRALGAALAEIGWADTIVVRPQGDGYQILDGHLRADVAADADVPVVIVDLDDDEALKFLATHDPLAALAQADADALAALEASVQFDDAELNALLASLTAAAEAASPREGLTGPDETPPVPEEPYVQPGDLWQLGEHRLLCGDATNADDVARLLGGDRPLLMVTDPPYGVSYDAMWREDLSHAEGRRGKPVPNDDRADWSEAWRISPADVVYCWSAARSPSIVSALALLGEGFEIRNQIIWSKLHFPIGRGHYHDRHEPCWYAVRKGAQAHWIGDRKQTTIWEATLDRNVPGGHSTQKPVELMERPLRNHSGDVYDPFVGSGTTIIAAERQHRRCYAIDIEPRYVQVALERWQTYSGETAERIG